MIPKVIKALSATQASYELLAVSSAISSSVCIDSAAAFLI
ncbi:hypothetical protein S7335_4036 [Synechococcus sp. PCC 7335]|nr:hypothetical protein S7335_4036 [Synechococcus sp. PCC 7335]